MTAAAMAPLLAVNDGTTGSPGVGTLFLALLVGLAVVGVLVLLVRDRQHGPGTFTVLADLVRLEVLALRERKLPDYDRRRPQAELDRRFADGWRDLRTSLSCGLGSRALAEIAAHDEHVARTPEQERAALLEKARVAKSRAAERRARATQQAELFAAQGRLVRDNNAMSGRDAWGRGPARGPVADPTAEAALMSAMLEATRLLAAQQAAVEAATVRRVAAELAADEAAARVRLEKEAAAVAHRARAAAERAAAKAKTRADRERRTAGKASHARVEAESAARRATERAAKERAAAKEAASRRQAAVREAARAEAAQREAATRELTARRAAEAAEASRRAVVATIVERQAAVAAGNPPDEVERRTVAKPARRSEARAVPATETRPRRLQVVPRTPDDDSGSSPPPHDSPAAAAAPGPAEIPEPHQVAEANVAAPARVPGSHRWKVPLRLVAALLVPAVVVVVVRTVAQGRWWTDTGPMGWSMLVVAMLLTVLGLGWVWFATDEPHALLPRTRRTPQEAELRHQARRLTRLGRSRTADGAAAGGADQAAETPARAAMVPRAVVEAVAVLAGVDVLVPLRGLWAAQLLVLVVLLTFPGFLVLRANRMTTAQMGRSPGWVLSASLVLLSFVGLAVDLLGPLGGLEHPLRPLPLLIALNVVCLALAALPRPTTLVESLAAIRDGVDRRATLTLLVPGAAALGALRLNTGHGSVVAIAGAVLGVALVALGAWRSGGWQPQRLAWCLYSGTLALLLGYSLRSDYVMGWDISAEYNLLHRTILDGHWVAAHPGDAYGAMLSLTVLPTFISALTGLSGLVILKFVYPMIFALTPIIAVALLRRVLSRRAAYFGGALLLTQLSFVREMPALARQEISLLLFASMLAALVDDGLPRARRVRLTLLLVAGVTVSHYSTTYTLATVLLGAVVVQLFFGRFHGVPRLNVRLFAVLVVTVGLGFFWYQGVTDSTSHTQRTVSQLLQSGLEIVPSAEGESRLHAYLRGPKPSAPLTVPDYETKVAALYARDKPWVVLSPAAGDAAFALREAPVPAPERHLLLPLTDLAALIFSQLLVLSTVIGTALLTLRRATKGRLNDFAIMAVPCVGLLGAARLSASIAETYGQDRLYIQLMPIIAVPALWLLATGWRAVEAVGTRLRHWALPRDREALARPEGAGPGDARCGLLFRGYRCFVVGPHVVHENEVTQWTTKVLRRPKRPEDVTPSKGDGAGAETVESQWNSQGEVIGQGERTGTSRPRRRRWGIFAAPTFNRRAWHTQSRQVAIGLLAAAVVAMTAISAGLPETAVGEKSDPNFYNAGEHFNRFYVTAPEVAGAQWLASVQPTGALTYTDVYGQLRLFGYGDVRGVLLTDVTPRTVDQDSWVYGTRENVLEHVARGGVEGQVILYRWPVDYLRSQLGVVYTNGTSEVYHR